MDLPKQAGRQAGRQVYVCADDESRLLSEASLPDALARRVVHPNEFVELLLASQVAAAVVPTRLVTPTFAQLLSRIRAMGAPIPLIELLPMDSLGVLPTAGWADHAVRCSRAHSDLVPAVRAALISRVLTATARAMRIRVKPVRPVDAALCGAIERRPPFESKEAIALRSRVAVDTLDRHWRALLVIPVGASGAAPSLTTCLDWALYLRALEERSRVRSWGIIAEAFHTTPKRLRSLSARLCGVPLAVVDVEEMVLPIQLFEDHLLPWLGVALSWRAAI